MVNYKVHSRLEQKRRKALDVQLNFIVDQTEKYSSWLVESLKGGGQSVSSATSSVSSPASAHTGGNVFVIQLGLGNTRGT